MTTLAAQHMCGPWNWRPRWNSSLSALTLVCLVAFGCSSPSSGSDNGLATDTANAGDGQLHADGDLAADATATVDAQDSATAGDAEAKDAVDAAPADAGLQDAAPDGPKDAAGDTKVADAKDAQAPDVNLNPKGTPSATITAPAAGAVVEDGKPVALAGVATDSLYTPDKLTAVWASDVDGVLGTSIPDAAGKVSLNLPKLSAGKHIISLTVTEPSGLQAVDTVYLGVCSWGQPDTFDTVVTGSKWKTYGDAFFDPGGWLEMTGNAQSKKGAIFNLVDFVSPGDVQISFKIATGGWLTSSGQPKGADGFALSVIDVKTVAELEKYINTAGAGGCLGYGVAGDCKQGGVSMAIDAFHIEIDTWQNKGDPNFDPTPDNHIGIMQNGDASNHYLWASVPSIEDLQWHAVTVQITKDVVRVTLDGTEIINKAIPDFKFRGGFIGFSGTTGWATNYHRFDDLQILQQCIVK